ncbi:hypothetical protein HMPREF0281_01929 [Corynebacterium ammoniagenes DSM 20306]|uniref:Uncharacterized protein n=1 Tax=Corynebacterium ammoniagenes DSM 20306 TaxID=649754 RepID=A0ABN0ADJ3_CORAM|nr:hypothetical protein HMPREF0281_01929 [Corynebacterium ammoniagenes DSM 20306]
MYSPDNQRWWCSSVPCQKSWCRGLRVSFRRRFWPCSSQAIKLAENFCSHKPDRILPVHAIINS